MFRCGLKAGDIILAVNDKVNRDFLRPTVQTVLFLVMVIYGAYNWVLCMKGELRTSLGIFAWKF